MAATIENSKTVYGTATCGTCRNFRPCMWIDILDLIKAGCIEEKDGYWVCYQCYNKEISEDALYTPTLRHSLR